MADSWTVTDIDRDLVYITIIVGDELFSWQIAISELGAFVDSAAALALLRTRITEFRNKVLERKTVPATLVTAIGFTETF